MFLGSLPKVKILFCAEFQGSFFTWIFVALFPFEKAEIQFSGPPPLF